jgi:hypothetical protein
LPVERLGFGPREAFAAGLVDFFGVDIFAVVFFGLGAADFVLVLASTFGRGLDAFTDALDRFGERLAAANAGVDFLGEAFGAGVGFPVGIMRPTARTALEPASITTSAADDATLPIRSSTPLVFFLAMGCSVGNWLCGSSLV